MVPKWIPLHEAYRYVLSVVLSPFEARDQLLATLIDGRQRFQAKYVLADKRVADGLLTDEQLLDEHFFAKNIWKDVFPDWDDPSGRLYLRSNGGCVLEGTQLLEEDLLRIWPLAPPNAGAPAAPASTSAPLQRAGPKGYDIWDRVKLEAVEYMLEHGAGKQSAVVRHVWDQVSDRQGGPAESTIKLHIAPFWRLFKHWEAIKKNKQK